MTYIEEMMKTAGIVSTMIPCPHKGCRNHVTHPCEVCNNRRFIEIYPDFTAEKQLEIIKLIGSVHIEPDALKCRPHTYIDYNLDRVCGTDTTYTEYLYEVDYNKDTPFEQALAKLTT